MFPNQHQRKILREILAQLEDWRRRHGSSEARAWPQAEWNGRLLPEHFTRPASKMHKWLCGWLDRLRSQRGVRLNVLAPRGSAKSTLGSLAYPLRAAVEGSEPLIWIVSETRDQAAAHLANLRLELEENQPLRRRYPRACGPGPLWRASRLRLNNGVVIEACSRGQKVRGRRERAHRPSLIVCDDLQSDDAMHSALARDRDWQWFTGMLLKAGNKRTNVVNLATALHREAIALKLARSPGWHSQTFAAIEAWPERMDLWEAWAAIYHDLTRPAAAEAARNFFAEHGREMQQGARLLWPEEEDLYTLMKMREDEGPRVFEREKQCRPANPAECEWPEYYFEDVWFDDWPRDLAAKAMALDPSQGKDARRGDYSAYVLLGVSAAGTLFVEADLARRPTPEMIRDGVRHCRRFGPQVFGLEGNHFQELLVREFVDEFARQGLLSAEPLLLHNHLPKAVRIRSLGPWLAQRKIRFRRTPGTRLLVAQLRDFPDPQGHDDGPDALEMAIRLARGLFGNVPDDLEGLGQLWVE